MRRCLGFRAVDTKTTLSDVSGRRDTIHRFPLVTLEAHPHFGISKRKAFKIGFSSTAA